MVEKAKKNMVMAIKMLPKLPMVWSKAAWVSMVPLRPVGIMPEVMMTSAVRLSTIKVSMNTPIMAMMPWSWGFSTLASAWAWGVEPMPASLENRPRATP